MIQEIKHVVKKSLSALGFLNPALGVKMGLEGKANFILSQKTPELKILVETGTEFGTLIKKIGNNFETVYSIELDTTHFENAQNLFKENKKVKLFHGDSATEIKNVLAELHEPALFWLDAHGPGPMTIKNPLHCPVEKELEAIFDHSVRGHVILIDDARHFDRQSISVLKKLAYSHGYGFLVENGLFVLKEK